VNQAGNIHASTTQTGNAQREKTMITLDLHTVQDLEIRHGDAWIELTARCANGSSQEITFFISSGKEEDRQREKLEILAGLRDELNKLLEDS
jgi:hypothetical protein